MTRRDRIRKWALYALGVLPVLALETLVLSRLPLLGVIPVLLPLTVVAVAFWEGAYHGALFGLAVGFLADAVYPGIPGGMVLGLTAMGLVVGGVSEYGIRQTYLGYLLCSVCSMGALALVRVISGLLTRLGAPAALAQVALKEAVWSLCFTVVIYPLFRAIYRKVGGSKPEG